MRSVAYGRERRAHTRFLSVVCAATFLALAWAAPNVSAQSARAAVAPVGNVQGLALLRRVYAAYRHVPGVLVNARVGAEHWRFAFVLHAGVTSAEEFLAVGVMGTTALVAPGNGPTYAHELGASCWRTVAASGALEDVGLPFPNLTGAGRALVQAPRRSGNSWLLTIAVAGAKPVGTGTAILRINAATMLLETMTLGYRTGALAGHTTTEHVEALKEPPRLPTPEPPC